MADDRIIFEEFEIPRLRGLQYLFDEGKSDYLFINEPKEQFSIHFETGFPRFIVPDDTQRDYSLFELKKADRKISFYCPEGKKNLYSVVWYFCIELKDDEGAIHELPGQIRLGANTHPLTAIKGKPQYLEILEAIKLDKKYA